MFDRTAGSFPHSPERPAYPSRRAAFFIPRDVQGAWLNAGGACRLIGLTEQLLAQANLALDLAQNRYNLGLSSIVELSQAQLNKTSAEIQNLASRYDFQVESPLLKYQMGSLR